MIDWEVREGDCLEVMAEMEPESVHCCITSPPYWGLRDYGVSGQIGLEQTPEEYVERMVAVFRAVRRVLRQDGTLWLNLGDTYATRPYADSHTFDPRYGGRNRQAGYPNRTKLTGVKHKDLVGIPWRVALALQADGWYLRSDIIWAKPNPMPESVTDRPTRSHEHLFLLSRSPTYYYDAFAIREPHTDWRPTKAGATAFRGQATLKPRGRAEDADRYFHPGGRNKRDVWTIATEPFPGAHFATFPRALVVPCVDAGTSERGCCPACGAPWVRVVERDRIERYGVPGRNARDGALTVEAGMDRTGLSHQKLSDWLEAHPPRSAGWEPGCACDDGEPVPCTVLDPFAGAGTTGAVACDRGRRFVGIELNPKYAEMARARIADATQQQRLDFGT